MTAVLMPLESGNCVVNTEMNQLEAGINADYSNAITKISGDSLKLEELSH